MEIENIKYLMIGCWVRERVKERKMRNKVFVY